MKQALFDLVARFSASDTFVFRTPLLPIEDFLRLSEHLTVSHATTDANLEGALQVDRAAALERLWSSLARADVRDALFVASPAAAEACEPSIRAKRTERSAKVERTAMRYFSRMTARPTPYGLFAGCSVGRVGSTTSLAISPRADYRRHSRLDAEYLHAVLRELLSDPASIRKLHLVRNSSLYRFGQKWRYVSADIIGGVRQHRLVAAEPTEHLDLVLEQTATATPCTDIVRLLVTSDPDGEITPDQAEAYVLELAAAQILMPDVGLSVTGSDPMQSAILSAKAFSQSEPLEIAADLLQKIDASGIGAPPEQYQAVADTLKSYATPVDLSRLFQVDLFKPASSAIVAREVIDQFLLGAAILWSANGPAEREDLKKFREAFRERYEQQEVPLLEALDEDDGIGFGQKGHGDPGPLIDNLGMPVRQPVQTVELNALHHLLLAKLSSAMLSNQPQIELTLDEVVAARVPTAAPLPDAFHGMGSVFIEQCGDGPTTRVVLRGYGGPSGARLLGRFGHLDHSLRDSIEEHLRQEEALRPSAVFAEIVHLPEGRMANILSRPLLRKYEIPYLGRSGAPASHQLPATDLLVSVIDDRIVLRSTRLDREIVPRLTTAHNYSRGLVVYRFLCALQSQRSAEGLGWNWGAFATAPFLPRISCGRLVLSRARWYLSAEQIGAFQAKSFVNAFKAVRAWREKWHVPRYVSLVDADNELLVDLDNVLSVETFVDLLEGRTSATVVEMLPSPMQLCATGPEGHFVHEILVSFVRKQEGVPEVARRARLARVPSINAPDRRLIPGSEWLYLKLYVSPSTADSVIRYVVADLVRPLEQMQLIDRWFFVRYADPEYHIRVRVHAVSRASIGEAVARVAPELDRAVVAGLVRSVQFDSYEREIERYGGPDGITLAEILFHADSEAAAAIIATLTEIEDADDRWRMCLRSFDALLVDFGFSLNDRLEFATRRRASTMGEFGGGKTLKIRLGEKYRAQRSSIEAMLYQPPADEAWMRAHASISHRSIVTRRVASELASVEKNGGLSRTRQELLASYLHMAANRLLRSGSNVHELVMFDFLSRFYESAIARASRAAIR